MPASPWVHAASPEADREYLVLATYLPVERFRAVPKMFAYSRSVQRQLGRTRGLVGYSMRAAPWKKDFWTLSAWEDEQALAEFVRAEPHGNIMSALASQMGATRFTRWRSPGERLPPAWDEALRRLRDQEGPAETH